MAKDWIGNKKSTFVTLGASNHTDKERQMEDYYATEKHIKAFWSMQERDMGIEGKMFGTTECRLMCGMGIPAYKENLTTWKNVLDYLRPIGEKMYRIHKQRKFYGRIFGNLPR